MIMNEKNTRREFLKSSGMLTAGVVVAATFPTPLMVHAAGSDQLKVAVIGCGGRGTGAAIDCFKAGGNVKFVAVADAFENQAKNAAAEIAKQCGEKADIAPERIFWGLDAFQKAIDAGVDLVILAGPPGFRPQHYEAAVKAGKHVFMEKPVCVCPGGFRKAMAANEMAAEKNLKVVVGLQRHHEAAYISGIRAIQDGKFARVKVTVNSLNSDVARQYKLTHLPTMMILAPDGKELNRREGVVGEVPFVHGFLDLTEIEAPRK